MKSGRFPLAAKHRSLVEPGKRIWFGHLCLRQSHPLPFGKLPSHDDRSQGFACSKVFFGVS